MTRTLLVGTERTLLNQTADHLRAAGGQALVIADVTRAEAEVARFRPSMIVVSLDDPEAVGWNLMFRYGINGNANVIATTAVGDTSQELTVLRLGAQDYIRLPVPAEILFARIKFRMTQHDKGRDDAVEQLIELQGERSSLVIDKSRFQAFWFDAEIDLTKAEFMLLSALARHEGMVKSRDQLLDNIHERGVHACVNDRNVDSHVKRLRRKFREIDPDFDGIETIYGVGYKLNIGRTSRSNAADLACQSRRSAGSPAYGQMPRLVSASVTALR